MRLLLGVSVLATGTACGEQKADPYAASLAKGSEHVEITAKVRGQALRGSGDFTNDPDRGQYVFVAGGLRHRQVFSNGLLYVYAFDHWLAAKLTSSSPQTPAQMFRRRLPATFSDGLVHAITVKGAGGTATYTFSKYGEQVSVTVPRVKGAAR